MELITNKKRTINVHQKSQTIRLIDVFFIGPAMIYAGTFKTLPTWLRVTMVVTGACTIIYNANNYIKNIEQDAELEKEVK